LASEKRKSVDFQHAEDVLLAFLHNEFVNDGEIDFQVHELSKEIVRFAKNVLRVSADELVIKSFVEKRTESVKRGKNPLLPSTISAWMSDEYEITLYRITKLGLRHAQGWSDEYYAKLLNYLSVNENEMSTEADKVPAAGRTVSPTDNQRDEASNALEKFIKEFRQDHHFSNEWAAEKGVLIEALESGKEYLKHKVIDVHIGAMMTIEPLKEIVAKYDQVVVGGTVSAMAQKLIEFLINLFAG